jgi:hypothetical protein
MVLTPDAWDTRRVAQIARVFPFQKEYSRSVYLECATSIATNLDHLLDLVTTGE